MFDPSGGQTVILGNFNSEMGNVSKDVATGDEDQVEKDPAMKFPTDTNPADTTAIQIHLAIRDFELEM